MRITLKLLIAIVFIGFGLSSKAQLHSFSLGPKIGLMAGAPIPHGGSSSIDSSGGIPLIGPNLGMFFLVRFDEKWSFWIEGNYNRKATEYWAKANDLYYVDETCIPLSNGGERCAEIETIFNGTTWGKFDNRYFEIDALARYSFNEKWHLTAGGYYSVLTKSESKVQYDGYVGASSTKTKSTKDLSLEMNSHDYGAILGFNYRYKPVLVDFRISYGLNSIVREDYTPIDYPIRNVFTQLTVAYQFFVKKETTSKSDD
ncbi:MAG: porin family protein [Salibacteraceae bacterium]